MATSTVGTCRKCNASPDPDSNDLYKQLHTFDACGHVMCLGCIQGIGMDLSTLEVAAARSQAGEDGGANVANESRNQRIPLNADCPVCQKQVLLPQKQGTEGQFTPYLKKFSIVKNVMEQHIPKLCDNCTELAATPTSHCLDCQRYLCDQCTDSHGRGQEFKHRLFRLEELKRGSLFKAFDMKLVSIKDPTLCPTHSGITLCAWCYTCDKALCLQCKIHHTDHHMTPIENYYRKIYDEIKACRTAADRQLNQLLDSESSHKYKRVSVEYLCKNVKTAILATADRKKRAIEADADQLIQDVQRFAEDFNSRSGILTEITECEKVSFDVWKKIFSVMSTETGDVVDDYLIDFYEFLRANDDVIKCQDEVVQQISEGVEKLLRDFIEYKENEDASPGNQVGNICRPEGSSGSQHASESGTGETCSSRPASSAFDDLDQSFFNIEDTELWQSKQIDRGLFYVMHKGVYKTENLNIPVAIKELDVDATTQELESFINEANKMRGLQHENLVKLIGVCRSYTLLLVTELAPLGSIGKYLKVHTATPSIDLYEMLHQITLGMKYLSEKSIIHRCLTARTVYLDGPRHAKIGSFGMSKYVDTEENYFKEKAVRRFPLKWYPPEAVYHFTFDLKSDVWSFGVVMWEVFSYGQKPYQNMKGPEILTMLDIGERLNRPDRCPKCAYDLMRLCWIARKDDRPTFEALEQNMKEMLQNEISRKSQDVYEPYDPKE